MGKQELKFTKGISGFTVTVISTRAPVVTAFNLFIPWDALTGEPRVIQKRSKGRWINKGLWAFTRVVRREDCVYFSWLLRRLSAALTEQVEPVQSHDGSCAFYSTYAPVLGLFVFRETYAFYTFVAVWKRFCSCESEAMNYGTFSINGVSDKIYIFLFILLFGFVCQHQHPSTSPSVMHHCDTQAVDEEVLRSSTSVKIAVIQQMEFT